MAEKENLDLGAEKKGPNLIIVIVGTALVTTLLIGGALYFLGIIPPKPAVAEHAEPPPKVYTYEALEPAFVVNFQGSPEARVMQVSIAAMGSDPEVMAAVKKHTPLIRNNLLLLLSAQQPGALKTAEGKEALRQKILEELRKIVEKHTHKHEGLDEIFFTSFVMQ